MGNSPPTLRRYVGSCLDELAALKPEAPPTQSASQLTEVQQGGWASLVPDLLRLVLEYLGAEDLVRAAKVCRRWQAMVASPPLDARLKATGHYYEPRISLAAVEAACASLGAEASDRISTLLTDSLHEHGFCFISFPQADIFRKLFNALRDYVDQPHELQQQNQTYKTHPPGEPSLWSAVHLHWNAPEFPYKQCSPEAQQLLTAYYKLFAKLSVGLLQLIARRCCFPAHVDDLVNYEDTLSQSAPSASYMRIILTHPRSNDVRYGPHEDGGLLTLMPRAHNSGGLYIKLGRNYFNLDRVMRSTDLLVFGGVSLEHLTARYVPALTHRVDAIEKRMRIGLPFMMRAKPDIPLRCDHLNPQVCPLKPAYSVWTYTAEELIKRRAMTFEEKRKAYRDMSSVYMLEWMGLDNRDKEKFPPVANPLDGSYNYQPPGGRNPLYDPDPS